MQSLLRCPERTVHEPSSCCRRLARLLPWALGLACLWACAPKAWADELPEYRLKAAFIYNFVVFTEWPADTGPKLNLCVLGQDPFGQELDALADKPPIGGRSIVVQRLASRKPVADCQVVFIAASAIGTLPNVLEAVNGRAVLTVADSPDAMHGGVAINMAMRDAKVFLQINLKAVTEARLKLSSKLLRLAKEII